jgi:N-acetylneuraminic acid mutarotase
MTGLIYVAVASCLAVHAAGAASEEVSPMKIDLRWRQLPALPDREGFAAPFAGPSGAALLVAGGANFPDKRPWDGGTKHWYDAIYVLEPGSDHWRSGGRIPCPNAYGFAASVPDGLVCVGGGDAQRHFCEVFRLTWKDGQIVRTALPSLPQPCAFASGALVGNTIYLSGGIDQPLATRCLDTLWALDLARPSPRWEELPACPGGARMLAVAGAARGAFFLFSGVKLKPGPDGKPLREYLHDAWRYTRSSGWMRLADLPRAAAAAASPAPVVDDSHLLVISGDDGSRVGFKPETAHPGFSRDVLAYDLEHDAWSVLGKSPFSRATAPTAVWNHETVIASGEARPGFRSPEMWVLHAEVQH